MALSGQTTVFVTDYNNLIFRWEAEQNKKLRTSTVTWRLLLEAGEYGRIDATPGSKWKVTIDGQNFSGTTSIAVANNAIKTLAEGVVEMRYRWWDGTKSFEYAFQQSLYISVNGVTIREVSGNGIGELDALFVSEPFCYRSFAAGVAAARSLEGLYKEKHVIGYSYNGVFLPKLPEWNVEEYRNAVLLNVPGTRTYRLMLLDDINIENIYGEDCLVIQDNYTLYTYTSQNDSEWCSILDVTYPAQYKLEDIVWSNASIYDTGGTLCLSASKPIPVYE